MRYANYTVCYMSKEVTSVTMQGNESLAQKMDVLVAWLTKTGRLAVALSGGMDSACLLREAVRAVGADNVLALTVKSDLLSATELSRARAVAKALGVKLALVPVNVLANVDIVQNGAMRCYHCKSELLSNMLKAAKAHGFDVLVDGTQHDDFLSARPGRRALLELQIASPLAIAGLTKADIRRLCEDWPLVDNPPNACLATRIPFGTMITSHDLRRVEKAERGVALPGVRVRCHGDLARIELPPEQWPKLLEKKKLDKTLQRMKAAGFTYIALDLEGYRVSGAETAAEEPNA